MSLFWQSYHLELLVPALETMASEAAFQAPAELAEDKIPSFG